jgi:probable rRNA maturation factor
MILIKEGKNYSITSECHEPRIPSKFLDLFIPQNRAKRVAVETINKIIAKTLGAKAFVSIVFVRQRKMHKINKEYRGKDSSTDILSFPLNEGGEILLSLPDLRKKAKEFGMRAEDYLPYLLIHGLLHLKGEAHGSKMDKHEKKLCKLFGIMHPEF